MQPVKFAEAAKELNIGKNNLYKQLRKMGVLTPENLPQREFINRGFFKTETRSFTKTPRFGETQHPYSIALVTEEGMKFLNKLINSDTKISTNC